MSTISIKVPILEPSQLEKLDDWLQKVLWDSLIPDLDALAKEGADSNFAVHRLKGRIALTSGHIKMIQGVREVFEITDLEVPSKGSPRTVADNGKLVLIGKNLSTLPWERSLTLYLRL